MDVFLTCSIIALAIQLALVIAFFIAVVDIRKIRDNISTWMDLANPSNDDKRSLLLSNIDGSRNKMYNLVLRNLYSKLYDSLFCWAYSSGAAKELDDSMQNSIETAKNKCKILGKELPAELSSLEAFKKHLASLGLSIPQPTVNSVS